MALSRFMSRLAKKSLPFFKDLKQPKDFQWMVECQITLDKLKRYLRSLLLLSKLKPNEILYLYLAVSELAFGSMLVK